MHATDAILFRFLRPKISENERIERMLHDYGSKLPKNRDLFCTYLWWCLILIILPILSG